jgi:hypothetical protein
MPAPKKSEVRQKGELFQARVEPEYLTMLDDLRVARRDSKTGEIPSRAEVFRQILREAAKKTRETHA